MLTRRFCKLPCGQARLDGGRHSVFVNLSLAPANGSCAHLQYPLSRTQLGALQDGSLPLTQGTVENTSPATASDKLQCTLRRLRAVRTLRARAMVTQSCRTRAKTLLADEMKKIKQQLLMGVIMNESSVEIARRSSAPRSRVNSRSGLIGALSDDLLAETMPLVTFSLCWSAFVYLISPSMRPIAVGAYGRPLWLTNPTFASSAEISRRDLRPPFGDLRRSFRTSAIISPPCSAASTSA